MNIGDLGLRLRNTVLTLVVSMSVIVNLVFAGATLTEPISLYTLLAYAIVLYLIVLLLEQTQIRDEDTKDALTTHVYPARMRTPMRIGFGLYITVWLLWWFVTQLFFDAGLVFDSGLLAQLVLVPLVLVALAIDSVYPVPARHYILLALLVVTAITLFFPTRSWAPQHTGALATVFRAILYFVMILLHNYIRPPNVYANLGTDTSATERAERLSKTLHQQLFDSDPVEIEAGASIKRRTRILEIIDAYQRIDDESSRTREFVALSAWLLVMPLALTLILFPVAVAAAVYAGREHRRREAVAENKKEHVPPPSPVQPLVQPVPPPPTDNRIVLPPKRTRALAAVPAPISSLYTAPAAASQQAPALPLPVAPPAPQSEEPPAQQPLAQMVVSTKTGTIRRTVF